MNKKTNMKKKIIDFINHEVKSPSKKKKINKNTLDKTSSKAAINSTAEATL